jgi:DNA helicase II / ATP-dependent DNA helicase PcrA
MAVAAIDAVLRQELTQQQYDAAIDPAREVLCLACAGSGKSRTLAYRIARLIGEGAAPSSIVAFTFTEKAAESIKRRVSSALSRVGLQPELLGAMYVGTIHSYCQSILGQIDARYRQFDVLDDNRLKLYLISRYAQLNIQPFRQRARGNSYFDAIKQVANAWKVMNDELITVTAVRQHDVPLGDLLDELGTALERDQFIDFSLMIRNVTEALRRQDQQALNATAGLRHLMIDEYQDVSPGQEELIRLLQQRADSLFVVGDDDQAIYAWRGADVSNIINFQQRYPQASSRTLSENFRSTRAIVASADAFVANELGPSRLHKQPVAVHNRAPRDLRVTWFDDRAQEAEWVADRIDALIGTSFFDPHTNAVRGLTPADFAILMYSTGSDERDGLPRHAAYTNALLRRNIQFSIEAGGGPFVRPEVQALRSTFGLMRDRAPTRPEVQAHFTADVQPHYPAADLARLITVLTEWGRRIHTPAGGARQRIYPQQLVYDLLEAFGVSRLPLAAEVMRDVGLFSRMIQDVEAVYLSVDSAGRFAEILNFLYNVADTGYDVSTEDVGQRQNAVTVATVHKVKGLEFPAVFVVDVENGRFPASRRRYEGWLPAAVMAPAVQRGAYMRTPEEQVRLFYTAMTRAERYLHISGARMLPGGRRPCQRSRFANGIADAELVAVPQGLPNGLSPAPQQQRISDDTLPTSFSEIRYYLRCPMDYRFRQSFGFSPPVPDMFGFGRTVHTAVGKLHELFPAVAPTQAQASQVSDQVFHLKHVPQARDPVNHPGPYERARDAARGIVERYASDFGADFVRSRQVEARFEIPAQGCLITGAIDLLLHEDTAGGIVGAEVVDFKAIEGGGDPLQNVDLEWTDLALQVQLYARAATRVLGQNAATGSVHLLKDGQRVVVPIDTAAIAAAMANVEWAVQGILRKDFPARPHQRKCGDCDFRAICPKVPAQFASPPPPALHLPNNQQQMVLAFSEFTP